MDELTYSVAAEKDIPFINEVYNENVEKLHGVRRCEAAWRELLRNPEHTFYIVATEKPVAWFRIDIEADGFWLGMLQVKPLYQRKGIGRFVLSVIEDMAKAQGCSKVGIHTTEDNTPARMLYGSAGYVVTEIGSCTTADGIERIGYTFQKEI